MMIGRLLRNRRAGDHKLAWNRPGLLAPETITLTSISFGDGEPMPLRTAGKGVGDNISPPLAWTGVPADAVELLLVIEDPDAPLRRPVVHLALAGTPPALAAFEEGVLTDGGRYGHGIGFMGRRGYAGPRPVTGHGPHKYVFQLYASSQALGLSDGASAGEIIAAADGRVLSRGSLTGTYER